MWWIEFRERVIHQYEVEDFATYCGMSYQEYAALLAYHKRQRDTISVELVDRVLTALGRADLFNWWYPWNFFDEVGRWRGYPVLGEQEG